MAHVARYQVCSVASAKAAAVIGKTSEERLERSCRYGVVGVLSAYPRDVSSFERGLAYQRLWLSLVSESDRTLAALPRYTCLKWASVSEK